MRDIAGKVRKRKLWVEAGSGSLRQRRAGDSAQDVRHRRGHLRAAGDPCLGDGLVHIQDLLLPSLPVEDGDHTLRGVHGGDPPVGAPLRLLLRELDKPAKLRGGLRQRLVRPVPHNAVGCANRKLLEELSAIEAEGSVSARAEKLHAALADGDALPAELDLVCRVQLFDEVEEAARLVLEAPELLVQGGGDDTLVSQGREKLLGGFEEPGRTGVQLAELLGAQPVA